MSAADGSEPNPLQAKPCSCSRPIAFADDFEVRCVRCGRTVESVPRRKKRRPEKPFKPHKQEPAGDPSSPFVPRQLELDL